MLRVSKDEFARMMGGQMPPPDVGGQASKRGRRRGNAWAAMHTLAVMMVAGGLLGEQYRLMGIGLCWALWMILAKLQKLIERSDGG